MHRAEPTEAGLFGERALPKAPTFAQPIDPSGKVNAPGRGANVALRLPTEVLRIGATEHVTDRYCPASFALR